MTTDGARPGGPRPGLLFFFDKRDGHARRVDGFLAQVLQHGHNHETFKIYRIDVGERPDLAKRFRVEHTPALCVIDGGRVVLRCEQPRGAAQIGRLLQPWLRQPDDARRRQHAVSRSA